MHKAIRAARRLRHRQLRKELHRRPFEALWQGEVEQILKELRALRVQPAPDESEEDVRVKALEEVISYLQSRSSGKPVGRATMQQ
jgi:hypothetical protein